MKSFLFLFRILKTNRFSFSFYKMKRNHFRFYFRFRNKNRSVPWGPKSLQPKQDIDPFSHVGTAKLHDKYTGVTNARDHRSQ